MTTSEGGGESERVAPVIPLFGRDRHESPAEWRSTWSDDRTGARGKLDGGSPSERHPARGAAARRTADSDSAARDVEGRGVDGSPAAAGALLGQTAPRLRALETSTTSSQLGPEHDPDALKDAAEQILVRKLRAKSLSVSEARLVLRGVESDGRKLDPAQIDDVVDDFLRRGYLDDAVLAGQLVTSGVERKGQGRVALSRALAQRGIPRDVIDAALDELPDDDAERALEYARAKARSLSRLDADTALRRLVGQLSRRGYNGSVAMTAAKTALAEATFGRPASGVRFVDSD